MAPIVSRNNAAMTTNNVLPEKPTVPQESELLEVSTDDSSSDSESLGTPERTASQLAIQAQVQSVLQHAEIQKELIRKLQETVLQLPGPKEDSDSVQEPMSLVKELQKRARNYGEDVLEDMLLLDKFSGLTPADRANRKVALAALEALLEDVDRIKANLFRIQKGLDAKDEEVQKACKQDVDSGLMGQEPQSDSKPEPVNSHGSLVDEPEKSRSSLAEARVPELPPAAGRSLWESLKLPASFSSKELPSHYAVSAAVSNLDLRDVKLSLSEDGSALTVTGLKLPTAGETQQMQHDLKNQLQQLPQEFSGLTATAYARMGQGVFGRFTNSFRLPGDVDVQRIKAFYDKGELIINLPKKLRQAAPMRRGFGVAAPPRGHQARNVFQR